MQTAIRSDGCISITFPSSFNSIESNCHFRGDFESSDVTCMADVGNRKYTLANFPYDATTGEYITGGDKSFFVYATPGTISA